MTDTQAIRARHVKTPLLSEHDLYWCYIEDEEWPCEMAQVLAALEAMDKDRWDVFTKWRDAEARERRLRAALSYLWHLPWDEVDDEAQRIVDAERRTVSHDMGLCHCHALATEADHE